MKQRHSLNFLLELLLSIVMFSVCAIVFVKLFALASLKNKNAEIKSAASIEIESIAEEIRMHGNYKESCENGCRMQRKEYSIVVDAKQEDFHIYALDKEDKMIEEIRVKYLGDIYA